MPNPENTEESKQYVAKVAEQLEEKDTQISVNASSYEEESYAVANTEKGGNVELSAGMSQLGASVNSENDSANNTSDDLSAPLAVENTSSGQVGSVENQTAETGALEGGMDEGDGMVLPAAKTEEDAEDTGDVGEPDTDLLSAAAENSGDGTAPASSAQSTLQNIISNVHVEEGRSAAADDGDASAIKTVNNSDDDGDSTAARTENSSGETTSSGEAKTAPVKSAA